MILKLGEVVNGQYREIERSLLSLGDFYLSDSRTNFAVQRAIWSATELTKRERHVSRFLRHITPHNSKFVVSTDGSSLSVAPKNRDKKPAQTKRKRATKTTTVNKKHKL